MNPNERVELSSLDYETNVLTTKLIRKSHLVVNRTQIIGFKVRCNYHYTTR